MTFELRPYQQQAVSATLSHFRETNAAAVIVLPTGAGKSLIIAELARLAKRRILVLAHVKELVDQNHQKYESYGFPASVYAAGLNRKEFDRQVVFGSVQSVARNLQHFDDEFSLLIIDECHRVALDEHSQYQTIIDHLKQHNSQLKVLGLTATPYRLGDGWVYQNHRPSNSLRTELPTPFRDCIFELPLTKMINEGYLTEPRLLDAPIALYDFEQLRPGSSGEYRQQDLDRVLSKSMRATARICEQIIDLAAQRQGVMIFAATVAHAKEIMGYLPPANSAIILGNMHNRARDSVIDAFKQRQVKFLVNVSVLTTGFDAPHVDLIAILRPTQSVGLYQQIIGRGLRLCEGKEDCLILDYAGNTHDLYRPSIESPKPDSDSTLVDITCPQCGHTNQFWGKVDADGDLVEHFGRRCQGLVSTDDGVQQPSEPQVDLKQCLFRYRFKECPQCGGENDIAARQCHQCQHLLVDPDQMLKQALQLRDVKVIRCSGMSFSTMTDKRGIERLKVTYHDEDGAELSETYALANKAQQGLFYHQFIRSHLRIPEQRYFPASIQDVIEQQQKFRAPDFVVARQDGRFWIIREKVFDYEGNYRRAHEQH